MPEDKVDTTVAIEEAILTMYIAVEIKWIASVTKVSGWTCSDAFKRRFHFSRTVIILAKTTF